LYPLPATARCFSRIGNAHRELSLTSLVPLFFYASR
jgi:hypothetical protein